jgi:hypothetical protein
MSLNLLQTGLVKTAAIGYAFRKCINHTDIVIPQESQDWGFNFHPSYNEVVVEVEIHSPEAINVLFVNENYDIVDVIEFEPEF